MNSPTPSALEINLTRGHYFALRAWVQVRRVRLDWIAERYLGYGQEGEPLPDTQVILREIRAVRDVLIQRANQHGRPELADALQRDCRQSGVGIDCALEAISVLERLGTPCPTLAHAVELWFAPALSKRLRAGGVATIGTLIKRCNDRGRGWWRSLPRVGAKAAAVIVAWIRRHEKILCASLGAHVTGDPLTTPLPSFPMSAVIDIGAAVVPPLEAMQLARSLDGSAGMNRASTERCMLSVNTDYEALLTWLSLRPAETHTWRAYRKESERFLAWAVIERGKPLSSLTTTDCIAYRDFLSDPQPAARWCGPMIARWLPGWRPFQGALSPASQKYALTVLRSLCEFLVRQGYLYANPWDGIPERVRAAPRIQTDKALSVELWEAFSGWLDKEVENDDAAQRRVARAAILLLRDSGLRLAEACRADRAGLQPIVSLNIGSVWGELSVIGKRNKLREVPISERTVAALEAHWRDRGDHFYDSFAGPLLAPLAWPTARARAKAKRGERGYSPSGLHHVIAQAAKGFVRSLQDDGMWSDECASQIRAHALRHTFGVHAADAGVPVDVLQTILGHASMSTTTIYTRPGRKRRLREIDKLYRREEQHH